MNSYNIPQELLQAIVSLLGEMPARVSRHVLNAVEAECVRQDQAAAAPKKADE